MSYKLKTFSEFSDELENLWSTFQNINENPFLNFIINKTWFNIFGGNIDLKIISAEKKFIAPMIIKDNIAYFCGGKDLFDYHDLIYGNNLEKQFIKLVLDELLSIKGLKKIELNSILEDSKLLKIITSLENDYDIEYINEDVCPMINLPESFEDYLSNLSKKNRHEIRRKMRKFENNLDFKVIESNKSNIDLLIPEFFRLMKLNPEKKQFLNKKRIDFMSKIIKDSINRGYGFLNFIEIKNEMVASSFSFKTKEKLFVYNSGFNNNFSEYSVGLLNHVYNIKDKIQNFKVIDFLRGSEEYKYRIGCEDKNLMTINIKAFRS